MVLEKKNKRSFTNNSSQENNKNINLNENIPFTKLQVISPDGENLGVLIKDVALSLAANEGLDLVVVSDGGDGGVAVAKIMNYSKKLYEDKKKIHNNKKKSTESQNKEIRISLKIAENDLTIKMKQCIRLLLEGCRVKVVLIMKGREKALRDTLGIAMLEKAVYLLEQLYQEKNSPKVLICEREQDKDKEKKRDGFGELLARIFYLKK